MTSPQVPGSQAQEMQSFSLTVTSSYVHSADVSAVSPAPSFVILCQRDGDVIRGAGLRCTGAHLRSAS